jgi:hypothetical protein
MKVSLKPTGSTEAEVVSVFVVLSIRGMKRVASAVIPMSVRTTVRQHEWFMLGLPHSVTITLQQSISGWVSA